jgi:hypothetical protein
LFTKSNPVAWIRPDACSEKWPETSGEEVKSYTLVTPFLELIKSGLASPEKNISPYGTFPISSQSVAPLLYTSASPSEIKSVTTMKLALGGMTALVPTFCVPQSSFVAKSIVTILCSICWPTNG